MQQFNKFKGTKGFLSIANYVLRFKYMITDKAQHKARILTFWARHGIEAACDHAKRSQSTLYRWKLDLERSGGKLESLNDGRTNKEAKRKRITDLRIEQYIINTRKEHPRYGKAKLTKDITEECLDWEIKAPSESTVGRIIKDLKERNKLPEYTKYSLSGKTGKLIVKKQREKAKKNRRKGYLPQSPGDLIEIDTIVYFTNGIRRFIVTAIDLKSDFAFSYAYKSLSSSSAKDFIQKLEKVSPFNIKRVQTDNGQEFAKHFKEYLKTQKITHFHTYPRSPKMNAVVERFNRTIQEEFSNYKRQTLAYNINTFNMKLMDWLLWYNTKRRHHSLGLVSPLRYMINNSLIENSHLGWTNTFILQRLFFGVKLKYKQ